MTSSSNKARKIFKDDPAVCTGAESGNDALGCGSIENPGLPHEAEVSCKGGVELDHVLGK